MNAFSAIVKKLIKLLPAAGNAKGPEKPLQNNRNSRAEDRRPDSSDLDRRLELVRERLGESGDLVTRVFTSGNGRVRLALLYIDGMVDRKLLSDNVLRPIQDDNPLLRHYKELRPNNALTLIEALVTNVSETATAPDLTQALRRVLSGDTALLVDGEERILILGTRFWAMRAVTEPETESAVRGPREGFTETLRVNTSLLRRRIRHEKLRLETMRIGRRTGTDIILAYIADLVNPRVLAEARQRIAAIDTDAILESGYIEEFIEDSPWSVFPQIEHTERVDKAAAAILEGRLVIMTDNTPIALIVPTFFFQFLQAAEDYYERFFIGIALRMLRLFVMNVALILPAAYVAVITFHQEMLPTPLLLSIAAAREGVPVPAVAEALLMEATFEVLREAGVRLPKTVGQAVSIVGGLVVGDAAIRAGLVSPSMVIIVATTAISTFAIPAFSASISLRLLRFPLIFLAGMMGLYGVIIGLLAILIHLASLQSFGVPYLTPLAHGTARDALKTFARPPWSLATWRPKVLDTPDRRRQAGNMRYRPKPPEERELTHEETGDKDAGKR
ncbi:MAG: Spore germination protein B1 [Syntrophomonadaceae bacterium]|nr:Spore germination protein B1 [Bacillota bacterium]